MKTKIYQLENNLDENFTYLIISGTQAEDHGNTQHSDPHLEEISHFGLFSHQQPPLGCYIHNPHSMYNNNWNWFPKVDLNKFDGCNP